MHHKYLLIYALLCVALSPTLVLCLRYQDRPNESASSLSQTTPPTNSIDSKSSERDKSEISREDDEDANDDESYEDRDSEYRSSEILNMYKTQYATFNKKENAKVDAKNDRQLTTMKSPPARTLDGGSCLSTACLARKDIEKANEENIRKHILMKLGMPSEPNKTRHYPDLPQIVLERYCKDMGLSVASCFGSAPNVEYQSDGPINYDEDFNGEQETITEEEDVQFLSFENRIYAFPSSKFHANV